MVIILSCVYAIIGLVCWICSIKWMKSRSYVNFEDLIMSFLLFGLIWPLGFTVFTLHDLRIGEKNSRLGKQKVKIVVDKENGCCIM